MHLELIHIRRNIRATNLSSKNRLVHREKRRGQRMHPGQFQCATSHQSFPGAGDLDANPRLLESWLEVLKELYDSWDSTIS